MLQNPDIHELYQWFKNVLQSENVVFGDVLQYACTTFGTSDVTKIITMSDSGEVDSLLDLIFYPDLETQKNYERHWGGFSFTCADRQKIIEQLQANPISATILGGDDSRVTIGLPTWIPEAFVHRLNITWRPDPLIDTALARHKSTDQQIITRVHLRNASYSMQPHQTALCATFIEKMPGASSGYEPCLLFLLSLLSELQASDSHYDFLIRQKEFYFQSLCKAEDFERKRQSSNMEVLMLQGVRAVHGSPEQWRRRMRLIDTICSTLFGRTHYFNQPLDVSVNLPVQDD